MGKIAGVTAIIGSVIAVLTFYYSAYLPYLHSSTAIDGFVRLYNKFLYISVQRAINADSYVLYKKFLSNYVGIRDNIR
jgi:hypothetical protein